MREVEIKKSPLEDSPALSFGSAKQATTGASFSNHNIKSAFKDTQPTDHKHRIILVLWKQRALSVKLRRGCSDCMHEAFALPIGSSMHPKRPTRGPCMYVY